MVPSAALRTGGGTAGKYGERAPVRNPAEGRQPYPDGPSGRLISNGVKARVNMGKRPTQGCRRLSFWLGAIRISWPLQSPAWVVWRAARKIVGGVVSCPCNFLQRRLISSWAR